ncbi:AraC family transcriptional regulator [Caulobacter sp.]|jgi:AraC family transcriptional regulator|uniref:helix-turn-helix domain-containing protein n=1 Tax=Caulobacter sp. TaxID=78 RepID=UPI00160C92F7
MTFQTSTQPAAAPLQALLAEAQHIPPAALHEARAAIARLAQMAGLDVLAPVEPALLPPKTIETEIGGLPVWKARRLQAHIDANLDAVICNTELARLTNLSVSYFGRAFRKTFGQSAHAYVMGRRVALAQNLIGQAEQSLADIALTCGFADQAHMTRVFGKLTGVTPHRWRRMRGQVLQ